ncbi:MAG: diacylglycerol kinase family protein [Brevinematales bacterium]|nr:diacylglycerol kinase family protein [Brevinematales bacterium]
MKRFFKSLKFAFKGLIFAVLNEKNFRIHIFIVVPVFIFSLFLRLDRIEWLFVISAIFLVLISELINSAIEKSLDLIDNKYNKKIEIIKDISAGFVLLAALYSIIIGLLIFLPHLFKLK